MTEEIRPQFDPKTFVRILTNRPGVYRMLNDKGKVIYVGKARNLRKRVGSYFTRGHTDPKTIAMLKQVANVEVTVTNTEGEALILEYNLIQRHKPRFNVVLKDDKSYPYIHVTAHPFPRIEFHRGARTGPGRYFGPYPNAGAVRRTINELQKLFLIRDCEDSFFSNRARPCLQYQMKRCTAPCVGLIDEENYRQDIEAAILFLEGKNRSVIDTFVRRMEQAAEKQEYELAARYRDQIARIRKVEAEQLVSRERVPDLDVIAVASRAGISCVTVLFIRGGSLLGSRDHFPKISGDPGMEEVLNGFVAQYYLGREAPREIVVAAPIEDRALLEASLSERSGHRVTIKHNVRGDRLRWLEMARTNAEQGLNSRIASNATVQRQLAALGEALGLESPPQRLECFDVSHTMGEATVASCVVFNETGPLKSDYRRYNLSPEALGDDYAAMAEALRRRYERVKKGEVPMPDILFVDGGKGQLAQAITVLDELELGWIQVVAVAKGRDRKAGQEQLFVTGRERPILLPPDSPALHLVQQIRDEAHRFAIAGHRQRRSKARRTSTLEEIPGLGPKRRRELLRQFGGLQGVRNAGIGDLAKVPGISRRLAERIYNNLHLEG